MVGGDPMDEAIRTALDSHRMFVERCAATEVGDVAHAAAPDLVLVIGDAARDGGKDVLAALAKSSTTSIIPVVLLAEDASLDQRLRAFRHGAVSVLQRDASA